MSESILTLISVAICGEIQTDFYQTTTTFISKITVIVVHSSWFAP